VANVRFNVAKSIARLKMSKLHSKVFNSELVPLLHLLVKDGDADVRYCAEKALIIATGK